MGTKFIAFVLIFALSLGLCVYSSVQLNAEAGDFGPGEGELLYGERSEAEGLEIELRALLDSTGALGWRSVYDAGSGERETEAHWYVPERAEADFPPGSGERFPGGFEAVWRVAEGEEAQDAIPAWLLGFYSELDRGLREGGAKSLQYALGSMLDAQARSALGSRSLQLEAGLARYEGGRVFTVCVWSAGWDEYRGAGGALCADGFVYTALCRGRGSGREAEAIARRPLVYEDGVFTAGEAERVLEFGPGEYSSVTLAASADGSGLYAVCNSYGYDSELLLIDLDSLSAAQRLTLPGRYGYTPDDVYVYPNLVVLTDGGDICALAADGGGLRVMAQLDLNALPHPESVRRYGEDGLLNMFFDRFAFAREGDTLAVLDLGQSVAYDEWALSSSGEAFHPWRGHMRLALFVGGELAYCEWFRPEGGNGRGGGFARTSSSLSLKGGAS